LVRRLGPACVRPETVSEVNRRTCHSTNENLILISSSFNLRHLSNFHVIRFLASEYRISNDMNSEIPLNRLVKNQKDEHFHLDDDAIAFVAGKGQIALQFPDELLALSTDIAAELEKKFERKFSILADSTFSSCCCDEVAASHIGADGLMHFGSSCLSLPSKIPCFLMFGKEDFDVEKCFDAVQEIDASKSWVVIADAPFQHVVESLAKRGSYIPTEIVKILTPATTFTHSIAGRRLQQSIPDSHGILYLGHEGASLTNIILTNSSKRVISYSPQEGARLESTGVNKHLAKRFYMTQKARDAEVIGILVGTLGVGE
jgi:diphthamide biosynthesis protein 2